jgi:CheY-like chemotaxis protein
MDTPRTPEILLVEDNPGDVRLIRLAFEETHLDARVRAVASGEAALAYLRRQGPFWDAPRPSLLILDLNLPGTGGREVLRQVKADPTLAAIPLVVLTSSDDERDVAAVYGAGANCYVVKPLDLDRFLDALGQIEQFWLTTARLPPAP